MADEMIRVYQKGELSSFLTKLWKRRTGVSDLDKAIRRDANAEGVHAITFIAAVLSCVAMVFTLLGGLAYEGYAGAEEFPGAAIGIYWFCGHIFFPAGIIAFFTQPKARNFCKETRWLEAEVMRMADMAELSSREVLRFEQEEFQSHCRGKLGLISSEEGKYTHVIYSMAHDSFRRLGLT